ncbi:MAG: hypothetical protein GJU76_09270 [Gallionella sp.]|jgi:hypothetical protein|nr:hypothetical protein [Gallionella sp.]
MNLRYFGTDRKEIERLNQEIADLRNHIFNGVDIMEMWIRQFGSTDRLSSETRQWCAAQVTRASDTSSESP